MPHDGRMMTSHAPPGLMPNSQNMSAGPHSQVTAQNAPSHNTMNNGNNANMRSAQNNNGTSMPPPLGFGQGMPPPMNMHGMPSGAGGGNGPPLPYGMGGHPPPGAMLPNFFGHGPMGMPPNGQPQGYFPRGFPPFDEQQMRNGQRF